MEEDPLYSWDSEEYFNKNAKWEWTFAWKPRRCQLTGNLIWFKYAYRGECQIGYNPCYVDVRWRNTDAHLWELLKNERAN